jgi:hypothetical protein
MPYNHERKSYSVGSCALSAGSWAYDKERSGQTTDKPIHRLLGQAWSDIYKDLDLNEDLDHNDTNNESHDCRCCPIYPQWSPIIYGSPYHLLMVTSPNCSPPSPSQLRSAASSTLAPSA